jgi:tetratricopeptide (TPR) repeat protein
VIKIITPGNEGNSGPDPIAEEFKRRLRDPDLAQAVLLYFKGKTSEAEKILPKLRETREKAEFHKQAEELLRDIATVKQAYNDGSSDLRDNDPEKAADALNEALEIDERIVLGGKAPGTEEERKALLDKFKSEARRNIQQEMAAAAYQRGKGYMERQDAKHACKVWKLGYSFWRGNSDLLKAVTNVCTQRADENLKAGNCDSLKRALEFAVPGDGVAEKVPEKKAELKCP